MSENINEPIIHKGPKIDERPPKGPNPDIPPKKPLLPNPPQKGTQLND